MTTLEFRAPHLVLFMFAVITRYHSPANLANHRIRLSAMYISYRVVIYISSDGRSFVSRVNIIIRCGTCVGFN
ncbi:hypothetical protein EV421DRAFT_1754814 [Armillaria borealis]|uniref:Uncharacterized protein n=1 Tax=Armillaria borealis TaxID=47425 RepID=A0AA39K9D8_9AGAR|nr:hypothetical protein EV421DRAFT_1754814 [Armillaria borealis]